MSNLKKKDKTVINFPHKVSLRDTVAEVLSSELTLLEEKSKLYHHHSIQDDITQIAQDEFHIAHEQHAEGQIKFSIPQKDIGKRKATVYHPDQRREDIDLSELPELIKSNKNINRVVVEEINVNDMKRTQILFDQPKSPINKRVELSATSDSEEQPILTFSSNQDQSANLCLELPVGELKTELKKEHVPLPSLKLLENRINEALFTSKQVVPKIEKKINSTFLDISPQKTTLDTETHTQNNTTVPHETNTNFTLSLNSEKTKQDKVKNNFNLDIALNKSPEQSEKQAGLFLFEKEEKNISKSFSDPLNSFNAKQTEYRRKKDYKKQIISDLYYKTKKHNELFKLGTLFYRDIEAGLKSFAFTSQGNRTAQESTILGLASYFSYHMKLTTIVFTEDFTSSLYNYKDKEYTQEKLTIPNTIDITIYSFQDMKVIEFSELQAIIEFEDVSLLESALEYIIDSNELIFWDLPFPEDMEENNELFFPITRVIDNVSLIVKPNDSKIKDILNLKEYFEKYHIQIKGMIMSEKETNSKIKKRDQ